MTFIDDLEDSELADLVRAGDVAAYATLHERHETAARAAARQLSRSSTDADDLVAEAFARVLAALTNGGGPTTSFRPYLLTTLRRVAYDRTDRVRRETPIEDAGADVPSPGPEDPAMAALDRSLAAEAFASLPERWQAVLWHTEVEGRRPAEIAPLLGLRPNSVAALAYRAREGLRQAYLTTHLAAVEDPTCRRIARQLGAEVRGALVASGVQTVRAHLEGCSTCRAARAELELINGFLQQSAGISAHGARAARRSGARSDRLDVGDRAAPDLSDAATASA